MGNSKKTSKSETETETETETEDAKQASFKAWAVAQGITTNGVDYCKIPNSGLGIVAQRRLKAGEELVNVPFKALIAVHTVPRTFQKKHKQITTQGLLASFLASSDIKETAFAPWASTWPTLADFRESMPICWRQQGKTALTEELLDEDTIHDNSDLPFPPAIGHPTVPALNGFFDTSPNLSLLKKQRKKLKADWKSVTETLPKTSFETYVHYWLLVNARTFYFEMPNVKTHPPRDDRIVMCPLMDLFNHNDTGCHVRYGPAGYTVTTDRAYDAGDEIYVSYGRHTNDFLLVEYGFVLNNNRWDSTPVDHCLMTHLVNTPAEERLQQAGYLGGYFLSFVDGVCFRTVAATRAQFLSEGLWNDFVTGRDIDRPGDERKTQALVASQVLEPYLREAEMTLEWLQTSSRASSMLPYRPRQILIQRWEQIQALLQRTMEVPVGDTEGGIEDPHKR